MFSVNPRQAGRETPPRDDDANLKPDIRTDAERFLDTVKIVVSVRKKDVDDCIRRESEERKDGRKTDVRLS